VVVPMAVVVPVVVAGEITSPRHKVAAKSRTQSLQSHHRPRSPSFLLVDTLVGIFYNLVSINRALWRR
jgi:hypothetical protein